MLFFISAQNTSNRSLLYRAREHFESIGKRTFSYFLGKDKFGLIDSITVRRLHLSVSRVLASLVLPRYYKTIRAKHRIRKNQNTSKKFLGFPAKLCILRVPWYTEADAKIPNAMSCGIKFNQVPNKTSTKFFGVGEV